MFGKMQSELLQRSLINGLAIIVAAALIFFAQVIFVQWLITLVVAVIASVALWEFYKIIQNKGFCPFKLVGVGAAFFYIIAIYLKTNALRSGSSSSWDYIPFLILLLAFFFSFAHATIRRNSSIADLSTTFFGLIYIAVPLSCFILILYFFPERKGFYGNWWLAYLIAVTKTADMGGYFIGRRFGKHKLALKLSPNKTVEGAFGGLCAAIAMSLIVYFLGRFFGFGAFSNFKLLQALIIGCLIGIVGQCGDLAESLLKRDAGVKDSNAIPGVGGILDMMDSLLFTAPLLFLFLNFNQN